jgi:toxin CcdB
MSQFDVHRNLGRTRAAIPFVVLIQSERYESTGYRVSVPLVPRGELATIDSTLNPTFTIEGMAVVMDPLQIVTIPVKSLGPKVDNLDQSHLTIIRAIDALIAQGK